MSYNLLLGLKGLWLNFSGHVNFLKGLSIAQLRIDASSLSNVVNNELYNCNVLCKSIVKPCLSSFKKPVHFGLYQNCRGLRTKLSTMNLNIADFDYIFISLSETWITDGNFSNELGLFNYKVFRCNRSNVTYVHNRGGGVQ